MQFMRVLLQGRLVWVMIMDEDELEEWYEEQKQKLLEGYSREADKGNKDNKKELEEKYKQGTQKIRKKYYDIYDKSVKHKKKAEKYKKSIQQYKDIFSKIKDKILHIMDVIKRSSLIKKIRIK